MRACRALTARGTSAGGSQAGGPGQDGVQLDGWLMFLEAGVSWCTQVGGEILPLHFAFDPKLVINILLGYFRLIGGRGGFVT